MVFLAGFVLSSCARENPHVKSGREMLTEGKIQDAIKEFKTALEDSPKDPKAKALLFYAEMLKERDINAFSALVNVYMCSEAGKDKLIKQGELEKQKIELRDALYRYGLETEDWKELERIAAIAGKEAFAQPAPDKDDYMLTSFKIMGAVIAAKEGNPEATRYLVKVMKDYEDENIYLYLLAYQGLGSIGKAAARPLRDELANSQSLLRGPAEQALTLIDAVDELVEFKRRMPGGRSIRSGDVPAEIYDDYFGSLATIVSTSGAYYLGDYQLSSELANMESVDSEGSGKPAKMLMVYGINPGRDGEKFFAAFYRWDAKAMGWSAVKVGDAKGRTQNVLWAARPFVELADNEQGYLLSTATVSEKTVYKTEWDWETFSSKRVPVTRMTVDLEPLVLGYSEGLLSVKPK